MAIWAVSRNFGVYRTLVSNTDNGGFALTVEGGKAAAWINVEQEYVHLVSEKDIAVGDWHHYALVFDGKTASLFIDGENVASTSRRGSITPGSSSLMIGNEPSGTDIDPEYPGWHGVVDEFYLYNRALEVDEIRELMEVSSG